MSPPLAVQVQAEEKQRGKAKLEAQSRSHERLVAKLQEQRHEEPRRCVRAASSGATRAKTGIEFRVYTF